MRSLSALSFAFLLLGCTGGDNSPNDGGSDQGNDLGNDLGGNQCTGFPVAPAPSGSCAANAGVAAATLSSATTSCIATATATGDSALCAACECGSCRAPMMACYASGDSAKDALCQAVVDCARASDCTGDDCYCLSATCLTPGGPCVAEINAAMGGSGLSMLHDVRDAADPASPLVRAENLIACSSGTLGVGPELIGSCHVPCEAASADCNMLDDLACQDRRCTLSSTLQSQRASSASQTANPVITEIRVNGNVVWTPSSATPPTLTAGQTVTLVGTGLGNGPDVDFTKIMLGSVRVLETDLPTYEQRMDFLDPPFNITLKNYEVDTLASDWPRDVLSWTNTQIVFRVPVHAHEGPLVVQVQKRLAPNASLLRPGESHVVVDALSVRIRDQAFDHACDVVSELGPAVASTPIPVNVTNPQWAALRSLGEAIFWGYDFNIGLAHELADFGWDEVLAGTRMDPFTNQPGDPLALFGAFPNVRGQVPDVAMDDYMFSPYPSPSPIPGLLAIGAQFTEGNTSDSGFAGYRYAESNHPLAGAGEWIGFNCASCHGYRLSYERAPGQTVTRVVPGLPNPLWSMKWIVLGQGDATTMDEPGPLWAPGEAEVNKAALIYAMPQGTGEHNIFLPRGLGGHYDNDYQYSVIAIPNVTNYLPIRRSLGHTESYVGFEGSYIHSEEPDGAMGSMLSESLQAFTAYMSTLDQYDDELRRAGLYRWLAYEGRLECEVGTGVGEGQFVQAGWEQYPTLMQHIEAGEAIFEARCGSCHEDGVSAHTNERMIRLDQVGRFFTPTIFQKMVQSTRATYLRDLYWVQHRGLLTDGHVRNLRDLVHPDRCTVGSDLYDAYYTLHPPTDPGPAGPDFPTPYPATYRRGDVFRVARDAANPTSPSNLFIERHKYFVTVPWDDDHYYWDFQKFRTEYGPAEMGTPQPIGLPATPHPWCVCSEQEVDDLLHYLLTL